jgi:hypothetical protein
MKLKLVSQNYVNFKYDFNMLNILYVNCCGLVNKLHFPEFENLVEKHSYSGGI